MNKFKVGDVVRHLRDINTVFLKARKVYTVTKVQRDGYIEVGTVPCGYSPANFELVEPEEPLIGALDE